MSNYLRTNLQQLEAEAIYVLRETAAQFERPVMLFSGGKDSIVMAHLAQRAFWPGKIPFPLLHIDTGHNFAETLAFRDELVRWLGVRLLIASVQDAIDRGRVQEEPGHNPSRNTLQTVTLLDALAEHKFEAALGGGRRDEEKARAKERFFSHRDRHGQWDPKNQRPELWTLYNGRKHAEEGFRVFPLSNWTEMDIWQYIRWRSIPIPSLYFAHCRDVLRRQGTWLAVSPVVTPLPYEQVVNKLVRFRTIGDMTCTGAVESTAATLDAIIAEIAAARVTERGRVPTTSVRMRRWKNARAWGIFEMSHRQDADPYLSCDMLRFTTAGSVDDGKSTLIGRLLLDTKSIFEDQLEAVERASYERGEQYVDLALFTDGLRAEREQRITIDVAYRFFATPRRKFIIADTPGHIQYTRNMITGASTAELAIILIDAERGVLTQSKRHGFLASLLHIPHILVTINKMDLVGYSQAIYEDIVAEYTAFATKLSVPDLTFIPISALAGDNVVHSSENMPWYAGPTLLYHLEHVSSGGTRNLVDFRFPVQMALRPNHTFRGFMGQIASGTIHPGDEVMVLPGGQKSCVRSIVTFDGELEEAAAGDVVTLTLEDEIDISRGNMIVRLRNVPQISTALECTLCWMNEEPLNLHTDYILQHTTRQVRAHVKELTYRINVDTLHREPAHTLELNEIGRVSLSTTQPIFFDSYQANRATGNFILIDPYTNNTVAAGMIRRTDAELAEVIVQEAERPKSTNVMWEHTTVGRELREERQGHKAAVLWFTGLSGSGKSTIAQHLERRLFALGCQVIYLDGDNVRHGLNGDLGFSAEDRKENIRRVAEVAKLTFENGLLTLCAFISPFAADRQFARSLAPADRFVEIYVKCDLEVATRRDPKGLYAKAQRGEIRGFTGIDEPYEVPQHPELLVNTMQKTPEENVDEIIAYLKENGIIHKSQD